MVFWFAAERPRQVCYVLEMSVKISIRRGKAGHPMHIPQPIGWEVLIIKQHNKGFAYQHAADPLQINYAFFWNIYSTYFSGPHLKSFICVYLCPVATIYIKKVSANNLTEMLKVFRNRLSFLFLPHSPFTISPMPDCSVVAVSLCVGEACMCILTQAMLRYPPFANTECLMPVLHICYK